MILNLRSINHLVPQFQSTVSSSGISLDWFRDSSGLVLGFLWIDSGISLDWFRDFSGLVPEFPLMLAMLRFQSFPTCFRVVYCDGFYEYSASFAKLFLRCLKWKPPRSVALILRKAGLLSDDGRALVIFNECLVIKIYLK
jgi:hypothetical protein